MATRQTIMAGWSELEGARWSASHLKKITQPTYFLSVLKEGTKEGTHELRDTELHDEALSSQ